MANFMRTQFPPVPEDKEIKTGPFLEACDQLPEFFDLLGTVFKPVKSDIVGNIQKIRKRYLECPEKFETVNKIIIEELQETDKSLKQGGQGIATNALMWLRRGLHFILLFLEHFIAEDYDEKGKIENLRGCAQLAYNATLSQYHGFLVRNLFKMGSAACPYRSTLIAQIAEAQSIKNPDEVIERGKAFVPTFRDNVLHLKQLFIEQKQEKDGKA